ncbi:putative tetrahydrocannabinolic acid synthase [Helianthus annuus]|nr:putative tetrahydrocannabinolic acid synthase [Helianthus annuus]
MSFLIKKVVLVISQEKKSHFPPFFVPIAFGFIIYKSAHYVLIDSLNPQNMNNSRSVFLLVLALSFCVSFGALSSIFDVTSTSEDFITCLQSNSNNVTTISQLVFTPANTSYIPIWQAAADPIRFNKSYIPKPSVIVTPTDETQIQTALLCAKKHGYEFRIRDGGHDFEGNSYTANAPFVMLDLVNMRAIEINVENRTALVQGGALLDLFWALRGGGASSFGIVLQWKLNLVPVPERVTLFSVSYTLEQGATDIFHKYQYVLPKFDRDLLIRVQLNTEYIGNTTQKTVRILFHGIYQGNIDTLLPLLNQSFPELNVTREVCQEVRMVQTTLEFGGFNISTPTSVLANRSAIPKLSFKGKSDYVRTPIPRSGLRKLWRKMFENDNSQTLFMYTFGGKMEEYSDTAIPYPHRAGVLYQVFKRVDFVDQPSDKTLISLRRLAWLRSFDKTLEPYVTSNPREAYMNYNDLDLGFDSATYEEASEWGERYWKRENFKKLIRIKAKVDPENFFRHPQSIPVFSRPLSDM